MDWIKVAADLPTHRKSIQLGVELGDHMAWAYVVRLWMWAANQAEDGRIPGPTAVATIATVSGWLMSRGQSPGPSSGQLVESMVRCGFLDEDGDGFRIHDWEKHAGAQSEERAKAAKRKRDWRRSRTSDEPWMSRGHPRSVPVPSRLQEVEVEVEVEAAEEACAKPAAPAVALPPRGNDPRAQTSPSPAPDPRFGALRAVWEEAFLAERGEPYRWQGAKDSVALKRLIAVTPAEFRERATKGLRAVGWARSSSVAQLGAKWNDLAGTPPTAGKPRVIADVSDFSDEAAARAWDPTKKASAP